MPSSLAVAANAMSLQPDRPRADEPQSESISLSQQADHFASRSSAVEQSEYPAKERMCLLKLAHESIDSALEVREPNVGLVAEHLQEQRGAFTSLYLEGEVCGCVGYVYPVAPLFQTVIETARLAAFQDVRFMPVTKKEACHLNVSISVLSPLFPIAPEQIELGKHGLLISMGNRRGLLLPQVPIEHGWDVSTFLQQTCWKCGVSHDAWQEGATIEAFTAEVFGDREE